MTVDVTAVWKKVADAAWGSAKCVTGSIPHTVQSEAERKRSSEEMRARAIAEESMPMWPRSVDAIRAKELRKMVAEHRNQKVPL